MSTFAPFTPSQSHPPQDGDDVLMTTEQFVVNHLKMEKGSGVKCTERWRSTGYGPVFIKIGRRVRYRLSDVRAWVEQQRRAHTSVTTAPDSSPARPTSRSTPRAVPRSASRPSAPTPGRPPSRPRPASQPPSSPAAAAQEG